MKNKPYEIGGRYGRLIVIGISEYHGDKLYWRVQCDCGQELSVANADLKAGKVKSCARKVCKELAAQSRPEVSYES
jgi:hypothetical protein